MSDILGNIFSLGTLWVVLVILYVLVCVLLIGVIMIQKGKGVGFAGAFGIGPGSETIFGPRGSKSLPARMTHIGAGLFMVLAFLLSALAGHVGQAGAPEEVTEGPAGEPGLEQLDALGLGDATDAAGETAPITVTPEAPAEAPAPAAEAPAAPVVVTPEPAPATEAPVVVTPEPAPETETPAGSAS